MSEHVGTLRIDPVVCEGHGRCYVLAPDLFEADDVGNGLVSKGSLERADLDRATLARRSCPEGAIVIELSD